MLEGPPSSKGNRYQCSFPECGQFFMSDEALQMHRIHHDLVTIAGETSELVRVMNLIATLTKPT